MTISDWVMIFVVLIGPLVLEAQQTAIRQGIIEVLGGKKPLPLFITNIPKEQS